MIMARPGDDDFEPVSEGGQDLDVYEAEEVDEDGLRAPGERGGDDSGDGFDDDGLVLDVSAGPGLIPRRAVRLEGDAGEWIKDSEIDGLSVESEPREVRDLYQAFVRHATSIDRLSEEEERALGRRVRDHQDAEAAKKLVVHNLRLAIKMAHQYRRAWTNIMDLIQEASAGMAIAAQRWDPDQGTRFGSYAVYWIRAQLTKFLMTHGRLIHTGTTRAGRKLYYQLPRVRRQLLAEGKQPTIDAIAERVGEDRAEVERIVSRLDGREASLSAPVGDDEGGTLGDFIPGEEGSPEVEAASLQMTELVAQLVKRFEEKIEDERDLAVWREHLVSDDPVSLVELGKRYGVSKQRMGQLATKLKRAFRRHVIEELGPHTQLSWLFQQD